MNKLKFEINDKDMIKKTKLEVKELNHLVKELVKKKKKIKIY